MTEEQREEWRPISGFDGYEVSSLGRVRNWHRRGYKRSGQSAEPSHLLAPMRNRKGYLTVHLWANGGKFTRFVHRLVIDAFCGPGQEGEVCRHLDGNPQNNRPENLMWGTPLENMADQERHGTRPKGERVHGSRLSASDVSAIRALPPATRSSDVARAYSVDPGTIRRIRRGASWRWLEKPEGGAR